MVWFGLGGGFFAYIDICMFFLILYAPGGLLFFAPGPLAPSSL
jgi:hypothetical protein